MSGYISIKLPDAIKDHNTARMKIKEMVKWCKLNNVKYELICIPVWAVSPSYIKMNSVDATYFKIVFDI